MKSAQSTSYDVIIIGAGGAGMMCAIQAARRGRTTLILDHASKLGGKILISGGGRCNFTNTGASPKNYVSKNPHFCKSALSRYPAESFIELVKEHGIAFHEKKLGQLFCDESAQNIVSLLRKECEQAGAKIQLGCTIGSIAKMTVRKNAEASEAESDTEIDRKSDRDDLSARFQVISSLGAMKCTSLVIATGGLSIPKIGATGFGYEVAKQFGLKLIERVPALDGFTFSDTQTQSFRALAGLSVDCVITCNEVSFRENILFTHSGLSGPAALQASLHWSAGDPVYINLLPELDPFEWFMQKKRAGNRGIVKNLLSELLPNRFAEHFSELYFQSTLPLPQVSEKALEVFCSQLRSWKIIPSGTVGYNKAEVTRGGLDTDELSSKTMETKKIPGLYFIGEVVDVTGWLGGYNFQWAWASGWAAGQSV